MNITKLPNGHFRVREMVDGQTLSANFDHKPTQKEIKQTLYNLTQKSKDENFSVYANKYVESKCNVLSASTIKGYRTLIRSLGDFGELKFDSITQEDIQKFINQYAIGHSPKSTSNLHGFISSVFRLYKPNMIIYTTLPKRVKYEPYIPSEHDVKNILNLCKSKYPDYYIPLLLACYGLRRGEICALTSDDIEGNSVIVRKSMIQDENYMWIIKQSPKSKAGFRKVIVSTEIIDYIKKNGYAYCGCPDNINNRLHDMQQQLNIPSFSLHKLRHYFVCMCHNLHIPDIYIAQTVGHEHISTTQNIYTHADQNKLKETQAQVSDYFCNMIDGSMNPPTKNGTNTSQNFDLTCPESACLYGTKQAIDGTRTRFTLNSDTP